jgi:hypothetical protein
MDLILDYPVLDESIKHIPRGTSEAPTEMFATTGAIRQLPRKWRKPRVFRSGFADLNTSRSRHEGTKRIRKPVRIRTSVHRASSYFGNEIPPCHKVSAARTEQHRPLVGVQVGGERVRIGGHPASCAAVKCVKQICASSG